MSEREARHATQLKEWQKRVRACRSSGQTVRDWCADQGICVQTYYRWERETRTSREGKPKYGQKNMTQQRTNGFVELSAGREGSGREQEKVIAEIRTGKAEIRIYAGASTGNIRALCDAVC